MTTRRGKRGQASVALGGRGAKALTPSLSQWERGNMTFGDFVRLAS